MSHDRWLVSYADLITLLLAFFVVLYASSQVDHARMSRLAAAIEGAFQDLGAFQDGPREPHRQVNVTQPRNLSAAAAMLANSHSAMQRHSAGLTVQESEAIRAELEKILDLQIRKHEVALRAGPEGLVISLREIGFFDSGSAVLKSSAEPTMARIAELLRSRGVLLRIEGHTDDFPIHTGRFGSNWELSTARATELVKLLISRYSFPPSRLSAAGFGEFHPIVSNATRDGRRQNRRVDLVILGETRAIES